MAGSVRHFDELPGHGIKERMLRMVDLCFGRTMQITISEILPDPHEGSALTYI